MNAETITIIVNGQETDVPGQITIAKFIESRGWKPTQVVVEHNSVVVPRTDVEKVDLKNGDKLEIIIPVAGG